MDNFMPAIEPQVNFAFNPASLRFRTRVDYDQLMVESQKTGSAIKAALRRLGRTQGWLAAEMDVSDAAVSKWIRKGTIAREHVARVADLLEIPASVLLCGSAARTEPGEDAVANIRRQSRIDTLRRMFHALADEFGVELEEVLHGSAQRMEVFDTFDAPPLPIARPTLHEDRASYAAESDPGAHDDAEQAALHHRERRRS